MSTSVFVNPLPGLYAFKLLQFDFPAERHYHGHYHAPGCLPNINLEAPAIEEAYGKLGTPKMEQGHPLMREYPYPEGEDPYVRPYCDQIVDIDRRVRICHTGRLSGSFVRFLAHDPYRSIVRFKANPLTSGGPVLDLEAPIERSLTAQPPQVNEWFWKDARERLELLFTAQITFSPKAQGLKPGNLYKLMVMWEFWDYSIRPEERMPISGFNEAMTFEVSAATANM